MSTCYREQLDRITDPLLRNDMHLRFARLALCVQDNKATLETCRRNLIEN